jgi:hypothetical protein
MSRHRRLQLQLAHDSDHHPLRAVVASEPDSTPRSALHTRLRERWALNSFLERVHQAVHGHDARSRRAVFRQDDIAGPTVAVDCRR